MSSPEDPIPPRRRGKSRLRSLEKLFAEIHAAVWLLDPQGTVRYCSGELAIQLNVERDALLGHSCVDAAKRLDSPEDPADSPIFETQANPPDSSRLDRLLAELLPPVDRSARGYHSASRQRISASGRKSKLDMHWVWLASVGGGPTSEASGSEATGSEATGWILGILGEYQTDHAVPLSVWTAPGGLCESTLADEALHRVREEHRAAVSWMISGPSESAARLRRQIDLASHTTADVGLFGLPGCGLRSIAWQILRSGSHADAPVIAVDGSLMDAELLQVYSEPIVHRLRERTVGDAFVGSFLIERIDEMPRDAQQQLVSWLEDWPKQLRLVGLASPRSSNDQADDSQQSERVVDSSVWLPEIRVRLLSFIVDVPRLPQRREDLTHLATVRANHHRRVDNLRSSPTAESTDAMAAEPLFAPDAIDAILAYPWPGQFDELDAAVRYAVVHGVSPIKRSDFPLAVRSYGIEPSIWGDRGDPASDASPLSLDQALRQQEKTLIEAALARSGGNRAEAARQLGISRSRLLRKIADLGCQ